MQTILIARTPHAAERNNIRSATAYEPADGSYKRKEEVRCLKTADFTKTPDFLHLRTAIACSREENAQDKKVYFGGQLKIVHKYTLSPEAYAHEKRQRT